MAAPTKKYGLIRLPKKSKDAAAPIKKASIFDSDSDEDGMAAVNKKINLTSQKNKAKRQTQMEIDKALADDPTVYCYDELYDDMKDKEKEQYEQKLSHSKNTVEKKSRYIGGLMKAAEKRQKEHERRAEKKVQKEREAEGDEFSDKEKFVTSAYKKKMAEMQALEEEEKRKEALEDAMEVTKQSDMSGFYRNLYKQTVGSGPDSSQTDEKTTEKSPDIKVEAEVKPDKPTEASSKNNKRQYRQRHSDEDSPQHERKARSRSRSRSQSRDRGKCSSRSNRERERDRSDDSDSRSRRRRSHSRDREKSPHKKSRSDRHSRKDKDGDSDSHRRRDNEEDHGRRSADKKRRSVSPERRQMESPPPNSKSGNASDAATKDAAGNDTQAEKKDRFGKRNDSEAVMSARERYLARKAAKQAS